MNLSSYGKKQLSLVSGLLLVRDILLYAVDTESLEIYQVLYRKWLVDFFPNPNGEMVNQSDRIQVFQLLQQREKRQASNRILLRDLQEKHQSLSIMDLLLIQLQLMVHGSDPLRVAIELHLNLMPTKKYYMLPLNELGMIFEKYIVHDLIFGRVKHLKKIIM